MHPPRPAPILAALVLALAPAAGAVELEGDIGAHDPSRAIRSGDRLWIFHTGRGCLSKSSADGFVWSAGPAVFPGGLPAWVAAAAPGNNGDTWAPDVVRAGGAYRLYYSVSSWGSQVSAIGLATSPALDPADPAYRWTDRGIVFQSFEGDPYNAIDPSVLIDVDGKHWLTFGSYWTGIHLIELSPSTGKRIAADSPVHHLAQGAIEASCLHRRGSWYYLFFNRGSCCQGVESTYRIRVGRSSRVTGPYVDRDGVGLLDGGGAPFLDPTGRRVGPGHAGIVLDGGQERVGYHYYDGLRDGAPILALEPLSWDGAGWPSVAVRWMSCWPFQGTAEDAVGGLDGELRDGAAIVADPARGNVLDLRGGASVALHPGAAKARTFSAWVRWEGGADWQRILDFNAGTASYLFLSPRSAGGKVRFAITDSGQGGEQILESGGPLPVNVWTHVAVTIGEGGPGTLYVNGKPVARSAEVTVDPWRLQANEAWLGRSVYAADPPFAGRIDDLRIFSRALGDAEIAALAAAKDRDLLARYPLDELSGSVAGDASPHGNDAEVRGDPVRDGASFVLDGAADYLQTPVGSGPERTLSAWIRPLGSRDVTYIESVFDSDVPGRYGTGWGLDAGRLKAILDDRFWSAGIPVSMDRWIHVALAFDRTRATLHVDGAAVSSLAYVQGEASRAAYRIGRSRPNALFFHGALRDARIHARALAAPEIAAIFRDSPPAPLFIRADANADGTADISDAVAVLDALFLGKADLPCQAAADANGDGAVDISDPVSVLMFLFLGGRRPEAPYPACGIASDPGALPCAVFLPCR